MVNRLNTEAYFFLLPRHFTVTDPLYNLECSVLGGLQLRTKENFDDVFDGQSFVCIPATVSNRHLAKLPPPKLSRLRCDAPLINDSLWLPDHCTDARGICSPNQR